MAITKDIQNGSEIFFNAWNGTTGYTFDLNLDKLLGDWIGTDPFSGQTEQTTLDAATVAATQYNANGILFDGELTEFATAFNNNFDGIEWSLVAYDNSGFNRVLVTADTSTNAVAGTNDQAKNLAGTLDNMASNVNGFAETTDEDTYHITTSNDGAAYAGQFGPTYQGNVFDTTNTLGTTSDLYMVAQSSTNPTSAAQQGIIKKIATTSGIDVTATTYQENGVWKLKIEAAGATDGTAGSFTSAFAQADVQSINLVNGQYVIIGTGDVVEKITAGADSIVFTDGTSTIADYLSANSGKVDAKPVFTSGADGIVVPTAYTGPVSFLEWELLGGSGTDVITGADTNDFMNLLGGDDAANGGAGNDVLDGGLGSNFLTGGAGDDTFFLDGRGTGSTTWSTVTDFTTGDFVNIWGWEEGTSQLLLVQQSAGAAGFEGITHHYDLNNDGTIDTSITFTGQTSAPTSSAQSVEGNGYLFFA